MNFDERWNFFCCEKAAIQIKHMREFWLCRLKDEHCWTMKISCWLGYHPSGTYPRLLKNMDFVPYVRISRNYYYFSILMSIVNSVELIIFSHMDLVGKREHLLSKFWISKVRLCLKSQLNFFDTILVFTREIRHNWKRLEFQEIKR